MSRLPTEDARLATLVEREAERLVRLIESYDWGAVPIKPVETNTLIVLSAIWRRLDALERRLDRWEENGRPRP